MDFGGEFRFNFGGDAAPAATSTDALESSVDNKERKEAEQTVLAGEELRLEVKTMKGVLYGDPIHWVAEEVKLCDGISLMKADGPTVARAAAVLGEQIRSTDLVAGEYEGGLKLWECAIDLVAYLANNPSAPQLAGRSVAELGCGHGLPGIFCAVRGARRVAFQDYNACVLQLLSAPNLALNLEREEARPEPDGSGDGGGGGDEAADGGAAQPKRHKGDEAAAEPAEGTGRGGGGGAGASGSGRGEFRFFSGDWGKLSEVMPGGAYDVLLTSDSIYSLTSQPRLLALIRHCLAKPGGVALVAAKTYYFGVGGGTRGFESLVAAEGDMTIQTAVQLNDGSSNLREILEIRWKE